MYPEASVDDWCDHIYLERQRALAVDVWIPNHPVLIQLSYPECWRLKRNKNVRYATVREPPRLVRVEEEDLLVLLFKEYLSQRAGRRISLNHLLVLICIRQALPKNRTIPSMSI